MRIIEFDNDQEHINDFLEVNKKLYNDNTNIEDYEEVKKFLLGTHTLSKYFTLNKFLIYQKGVPVGRFIITEYPDDNDVCYLGFFECVNDSEVAKFIFDEANKFAKNKKYKKIIGPVDASFWYKYRLKINLFEELPYTGEPYNLDYYYDMFKDNGYSVIEHYVSNIFEKVDKEYNDPKFHAHYNEFTNKGYLFMKPKISEFNKCINEIYDLIMDLYSSMPIFKKITREDFIEQFSSYKKILNMDMVRMAYYKGEAVGFCISVPNYNNLVYNLSVKDIPKVLWIKSHPKEYVMLYLGASHKHKGLGKAIAYLIAEELKKNNLPSINALIRDGNINIEYGKDKITDKYEYVLLEKDVK